MKAIVDRLERLARGWQEEAAQRLSRTTGDQGAEALASCATELEQAAKDLLDAKLTPEEYAEMHHVTAQSVTRWCRIGELRAERRPNGWAIPADAQPPALRAKFPRGAKKAS